MKNKLADLWLSFLLTSRLKRLDFQIKQEPSTNSCCGPVSLVIEASEKWFWEKKVSTSCDCC